MMQTRCRSAWARVRDQHGLLRELREPAGAGGAAATDEELVTRFEYDKRGNLTSITYADGAVEHYQFDPHNGQLQQVVDPVGRITRKTLNSRGAVIEQFVSPNTNVAQRTRFTYTAAPSDDD